jgi:hypothetical protein
MDKSESQTAVITEPEAKPLVDLNESDHPPGIWETLQAAFKRGQQEKSQVSRRELGRSRKGSLWVVLGAAIVMILFFFGVFSSSNNTKKPGVLKKPGTPDLGRRTTPGETANAGPGSVTPILTADPRAVDPSPAEPVSAEDVGRTARAAPVHSENLQPSASKAPPTNSNSYALGQIDFSGQPPMQPGVKADQESMRAAATEAEELRKPSLTYVRSIQGRPDSGASAPLRAAQENLATLDLPTDTRLVARLETPVSTSNNMPVMATIEYNYEVDGEIVVPAGATAIGAIAQADRSGHIALRFSRLEMPDGTSQAIDAAAESMDYGVLKGQVNGKNTVTKFLVRAGTGLGTVATYLVGGGSSLSTSGISESGLLRERIANNVGNAGDQEISSLSFNQNYVVTLPGNTRFHLVILKGTATDETRRRSSDTGQRGDPALPDPRVLRQLIQIWRETGDYQRMSAAESTGPSSQ